MEPKLIKFTPDRSFKYKRTERPEQRHCIHYNIIVDEELRIIECDKCGIVLDPFDYLKNVCYQDESAFNKHAELLSEVAKLEVRYRNLTNEVDKLKRERFNIKNNNL